MVVMFSAGKGDVDGISEIGISHSVVPTLCGPWGLGTAGTIPSRGIIVVYHLEDPLKTYRTQERANGPVLGSEREEF